MPTLPVYTKLVQNSKTLGSVLFGLRSCCLPISGAPMKIDIERIKVDETTRIRQDIGDLESLQESIQRLSIITVIIVSSRVIIDVR